MADSLKLAKAREELEEIYSAISDESANLTFRNLAAVTPGPLERKMSMNQDHMEKPRLSQPHHQQSPYNKAFEEMCGMNLGTPMAVNLGTPMAANEDAGKVRRPGIPHTNICTLCSNYIYMCGHRCLVCGRAYCKSCGVIGMGDMTEGRKCLECLGYKFSKRYIERAGQMSCCMNIKYSSKVIKEELKWAEKGPRKKGPKRYSKIPITVKTPAQPSYTPARPSYTPARSSYTQSRNSFVVVGSPFSPYPSSMNQSLPL